MTKTKRLFFTFASYACSIFLSTLFFIALFHTPLLRKLNVFFYRGCFFMLLASLFAVAVLWWLSKLFKSLEITFKDYFCLFFLFSGFTLGWFVIGPTTAERSASVFMLSYMEQKGSRGITKDEITNVFLEDYVTLHDSFGIRFKEQLMCGNIKYDGGDRYVISKNGIHVVNSFRIMARLFNTERWVVYPCEKSESMEE